MHVQIAESAQLAFEYLTCTGHYPHETYFPQPGVSFTGINRQDMNGCEFMEDNEKPVENHKARIVVVMIIASVNLGDKRKPETDKNICRQAINKRNAGADC